MKAKFLHMLMALLLTLTTVSVSATGMIHAEYAAEITNLNLGDAPVKNGLIYVQRCDQCPVTAVSFSSGTAFFKQRKLISAESAMDLDGEGATVFFDPKTKTVTRVVFWNTTD